MSAVRAILDISQNGQSIRQLPLEGEAVAGRAEGCVIRLDDRAISRQHAVFRQTPEGVQVEKRSDFAPLKVNGADCTSAILKQGDVVELGPYRLRLQLEEAEEAPAPEAPEGVAVPTDDLELTAPGLEAPTEPGEVAEGADIFTLQLQGSQAEGSPGSGISLFGAAEVIESGVPLEGRGSGEPEPSSLIDTTRPMIPAGESDPTQAASASKLLNVGLVFPKGMANVEEYELGKEQVYIGRDESCEVVLNDRKASRRHALITRAGFKFVLKDMDSANGTWLNGQKILEAELAGGDRIRIGAVEFEFRAVSSEYKARERNFLRVAPGEVTPVETARPDAQTAESLPAAFPVEVSMESVAMPTRDLGESSGFVPAPGFGSQSALSFQTQPDHGIPGVPGVGAPLPVLTPSRTSLLDRFRALPPRRQAIWAVIVVALLYFLVFDEDPPQTPASKPMAKASPGVQASPGPSGLSFEALSSSQKKFVETQLDLAQSLLGNKEYDKSLFEVRKIFPILADFKNAREIERYALEGKRRLDALEEERKKKALQLKIQAEIAQLLTETQGFMDRKQFDQARALFAEIVAKDPENTQVVTWKRQIEEFEALKAQEIKAAEVRRQVNLFAWQEYRRGVAASQRSCREAIGIFRDVMAIGSTDRRPVGKAKAGIDSCRARIREEFVPLLAEAKQLEQSGALKKAYDAYRRASLIDPEHAEPGAGMERIRGSLHARAKAAYTEAVLAESYSDFKMARRKYQETLDIAPEDDIYNDRARRKLGRFIASHPEEGEEPKP